MITRYAIEVWDAANQKWVKAPAPTSDFMSTALINADLWFPTERVQVVAVREAVAAN